MQQVLVMEHTGQNISLVFFNAKEKQVRIMPAAHSCIVQRSI